MVVGHAIIIAAILQQVPVLSASRKDSDVQLKRWLTTIASDSMEGRGNGTVGLTRATAYVAGEARKLGLKPAGDHGSYFQQLPLRMRSFAGGTLRIGEQDYVGWKDFIVRDQGAPLRAFSETPVVFAGNIGDDANMIAARGTDGKTVVLGVTRTVSVAMLDRPALTRRYPGAAAICIVALDQADATLLSRFRQGQLRLPVPDSITAQPAFLYLTSRMGAALFDAPVATLRPGAVGWKRIRGSVRIAETPLAYPARNVVAVLPATRRGGTYVAVGAHIDHLGKESIVLDADSVRIFNRAFRRSGTEQATLRADELPPEALRTAQNDLAVARKGGRHSDSINNGADDDGSGSAALLALARTLAEVNDRRNAVLFVWHAGEELGTIGSRYFVDHPTVPRDSIIAQVNVDMIGRGGADDVESGGPRYLRVIGASRIAPQLGRLVERENGALSSPLRLDYAFDAPGHPKRYYCRSDHWQYARWGIPAVFFSTGTHPDYHQVTDEVREVDFAHMSRILELIERVTVALVNSPPLRQVTARASTPGECVQ